MFPPLRAAAAVVLSAAAAAAQDTAPAANGAGLDWPPRLTAVRLSEPPRIDGSLDDHAWKGAPQPLGAWITYNPSYGETLAQKTEVWVAYDDKYLYFAFRCLDPEPDKVRHNLSRRDQLFNDDWVGLSLDSVASGQTSYDMFVNPRGVQADILNSSSAGEQLAPDWIWDSAGQPTAQGYEAEIRLPLKSIRFKSGKDVRMGVMFWRRVSRLGMSASWPDITPGKSVIERHAALTLHDLDAPLTLELMPSATYSTTQVRTSPTGFGPVDAEPDVGMSLKYGVTSSTTLEGTVNPDFSQVESDAFQVEVNQRFPIFYSEKRPFFMEGMGTFELAGSGGDATMRTAVHTRNIEDPIWGGKYSGTIGRVTFATLSASDEAAGWPLLEDDEPNPYVGQRKTFNVGRALYSLGQNRYVGGIVAATSFANGHNRVAGADFSVRAGDHQVMGSLLGSTSLSDDGRESERGVGGNAFYLYETKRWTVINQFEHYDTGFRMDTAFLKQVGITSNWSYGALSLYPDQKKHPWLKRVVPFTFVRLAEDREQGGTLTFFMGGVRLHTTRQGFFRLDGAFGQEPWQQTTYPIRFVRVMGNAQVTKWLFLNVYSELGRGVYYDEVDPFGGRSRNYNLDVTWQPSSSFNQAIGWSRAEFDRLDGQSVYRVNVVNLRSTYQFSKYLFVRGILRYDSDRKEVLTDLLGSFELLPGTVAYVGYGSLVEDRRWNGTELLDEPGDYLTMRRGFFFKVSYSHRF